MSDGGTKMRQSYRWLLALCLAFAMFVPGCSSAPTSTTPQSNAPAVQTQPIEAPAEAPVEQTVYGTRTGAKYHADGCRYLSRSKIAMSLGQAQSAGLTACSVCNP